MDKRKRATLYDITVSIIDGITFEDVVSQLQPYIDNAVLTVMNGETLNIHTDKKKYPVYVELESINGGTYYFRDKIDDDLYAVFGEENAATFCQSLHSDRTIRKVASISHGGIVTTSITTKIDSVKLIEKDIE
jgi:hypothetical protein